MTVIYQYQVANSTRGGFTRLLFMWRGSLYKLIYRELLLFLFLFAALSAIYRYLLNAVQKKEFEQIVIYCDNFINLIPLSFVLGFYVSYVAQRWWQQYQAIPWPDKVMHSIALYVVGNDEYSRILRRTLMRYLNLSLILVLRSISSSVKKRFPTHDHVVDSGFMTTLELELFLAVPSLEFNTYWIPCTWFINLLKEARENQRILDPQGIKLIMEEFNEFRTKCGLLWSYDWISIPLVYTQVVTLATYSFFGVALLARQYIEGKEKQFQLQIDVYVPVFTILQFFFFMGLLKVAEQLINPFGEDDEDFELNWIIDRHTKVSYLGVDTLMNRCPPLVKDIYFDAENLILPYTEAAAVHKKKTYRGSVANMTVPEEKQTMFLPNVIEEDEEEMRTSLYTSNMSLTIHGNDSPTCERRQINLYPETPTTVDQSHSETILQFDIREPSSCVTQTEQRSKTITETGRRFPTKYSSLRIDQNRKPFFALTKSPKIILQSSASTSNLSRPTRQIIDTPTVYNSSINPWKEYISKDCRKSMLEVTPDQSPEVMGSQLQLPQVNLPLKAKRPRHMVRRHKSIEVPSKKGIQWTRVVKTRPQKTTPDDASPVEEILLETRSSPNLKHLGDDS
nr:bestrophin-4-like isoform X1 [Nomia melanderi]XP_031831443.1 bestrophin-4-like isoform X1 [Nomia melanderi]XP_031831444.1 bestrophin-4-like isoform X1 [Nomia melanderi]XP_031831445.1 bestrophin-4-like isoform X1 [Nomia melanderi]XP_031831446.1 bestrophin-4-like isoform X1 [Nomia melanderi]XP_031831447.1 bestrophin-4-like isoform X1 [Nomia melanderi]XP_031831448.1 bestrophin-4-like isoform X1 [Nomia melanderi]XP_031831450.1 bestrophin-4-like isoform X1 [Nomia melanderi]